MGLCRVTVFVPETMDWKYQEVKDLIKRKIKKHTNHVTKMLLVTFGEEQKYLTCM